MELSKKGRNLDSGLQDYIKFRQLGVIRQNHPMRVRWDLFVMVLAVWNSMVIPIDIAFNPASFSNTSLVTVNFIIDFLFFMDIIINFRTTFHNTSTGDEVINPKKIAAAYASSIRFWIDILSTIPFDVIMGFIIKESSSTNNYQLLSMLKLFRILRLSRIINYMNSTDEIKLSLKLFQLCLFLILYIHCTACLLFLIAKYDKTWEPGQLVYYAKIGTFYDAEVPM